MASLWVQLLGKASIHDHHQELITVPLKAQELLFYLLIHHNQPHERETLSVMLWSDISPDHSKKYLRQALWQLQSILDHNLEPGNSILLLDGSWVQLDLNPTIQVDIDQLQRTFTQVRALAGPALKSEHVAAIQKAVALYQGELLTGWYHDWCVLERERFQSMVLALLDKLIDFCMTHEQLQQGIDYARHLLQYDKARERTHRRLMRLYYLANSRTAALRQFERCRVALAEELGVEPSKRTLDLYHQIQEDRVTDLWQTAPPTGPSLETTPESASPILTELNLIRTRLAALQLDIQTIKNAVKGSKDAPTDTPKDATIDPGMVP